MNNNLYSKNKIVYGCLLSPDLLGLDHLSDHPVLLYGGDLGLPEDQPFRIPVCGASRRPPRRAPGLQALFPGLPGHDGHLGRVGPFEVLEDWRRPAGERLARGPAGARLRRRRSQGHGAD